MVYDEFKEQLTKHREGWYETGLPWKGNLPLLPTNKRGSRRRLKNLTTKLQRDGRTNEYDAIIREQKECGVVETADGPARGVEFYIPHKAMIRESAETTKLRIVYDASARANPDVPSMNDCLYPGPPLQNKLWDLLIHQRAYPVVVTGDIQMAFLQVRIRENERDALRFHWRCTEDSEVQTLRFTRVLFGLAPSPFLLAGVIEQHLSSSEEKCPDTVGELRRSLYVDDLLTGSQTIERAQQCKERAMEIFEDATFRLHKWNSNVKELEMNNDPPGDREEPTYAKQQFGGKPTETKMLSLKWNKGLVAAKARLAKEGLTIPRLELVSAHMAANLVTNVRNALQGLPELTIYGWLDSTVALHWLSGNGKYKQFVTNRVSKIKQHKEIKWRHVPTLDNPVDLASRGESLSETPLWWNGPGSTTLIND